MDVIVRVYWNIWWYDDGGLYSLLTQCGANMCSILPVWYDATTMLIMIWNTVDAL